VLHTPALLEFFAKNPDVDLATIRVNDVMDQPRSILHESRRLKIELARLQRIFKITAPRFPGKDRHAAGRWSPLGQPHRASRQGYLHDTVRPPLSAAASEGRLRARAARIDHGGCALHEACRGRSTP